MKIKQAVILAAGPGKRMRPLTNNLPKVMLPLNEKPLLEYHLGQLKKYGIGEVFINLHYLPEKITNYFGDGSSFGVKINYNYEKTILGTGGALPAFNLKLKNRFILIYGDIYTNFNYQKLIEFNQKKRGMGTLVVRKTDHPQDSDLVVFSKDNKIKDFYLKPHENLPRKDYFGITGIYILSKKIFKFIKAGQYSELDHQILPTILKRSKALFAYETKDYLKDIGTIKRYNEVRRYHQKIKHPG